MNIKYKNIGEVVDICHSLAKEKGFWDSDRNIGESLMLVVTELSEAMEAYRKGDDSNFREEIADSIIRLFDISGGLELAIDDEIEKKLIYNKTRPYKHGKKC